MFGNQRLSHGDEIDDLALVPNDRAKEKVGDYLYYTELLLLLVLLLSSCFFYTAVGTTVRSTSVAYYCRIRCKPYRSARNYKRAHTGSHSKQFFDAVPVLKRISTETDVKFLLHPDISGCKQRNIITFFFRVAHIYGDCAPLNIETNLHRS